MVEATVWMTYININPTAHVSELVSTCIREIYASGLGQLVWLLNAYVNTKHVNNPEQPRSSFILNNAKSHILLFDHSIW